MKLTKLIASFCFALIFAISANIVAQDVPPSVGPAPYVDNTSIQPHIFDTQIGTREWLYLSSSPTFQFGSAFLESCTQTNIGSPFTVTFPGAIVNKQGTIYMNNQSSPYQMYTIDTTTGTHTLQFSCTGVPLGNFTGFTWDATTSTMFGVGTSISASQIFAINMTTGVCTIIGSPSAVCAGAISISAAPNGSLFSVDIVGHNLYRWNKTTGVPTLVGPLGVSPNFGQDAQFDYNDGKLYWASYTTGPALRTIDTTTGSGTTQLCTYPNQMTGITMALPPVVVLPLCEQFTSTTFPPTGWTLNPTTSIWYRATNSGFGVGTGSAAYDCWNGSSGTNDALITLNFAPTINPAAQLFVDMAYQPYNTLDSLVILASTNGGTAYTSLARLGGATLATTTLGTSPFNPTAGQWAKRFYTLPVGTNKIQFLGKSGFGDVIYIDSTCVNDFPLAVNHNGTGIPQVYSLSQNYPNPFNPSTQISFGLPKAGTVKLVVYDILGREVKTLVNDFRNAGTYNIAFDASSLASGIYFYTIKANDFTETKKMLLVK